MTDQTGAHAQFPLDSVRPAIPCKMMVRAMLPSASPPISTNNHLTVSAHLTHFEENFFKDQTEVISPETLYKCFMCTLSERIVEDIVIKTQTILTMWNSTKNSQNMAKIHVEHYYLARAILLRDYGSLGITHTPSTIYQLIRSKMSLPSLQHGTTHDPLHQIVQQCVRMGELDETALKITLGMAIFTMPPIEAPLHGTHTPDSMIVRNQVIESLIAPSPEPRPLATLALDHVEFDHPLKNDIELHFSRFESTTTSAMHEWHETVLETFSPTFRRRVVPLVQNVGYKALKDRLIARYGITSFDEEAFYAHHTCQRPLCNNVRWYEFDFCCNSCRRSTHGANSPHSRSWFVYNPVRYILPTHVPEYAHPPTWCKDCPVWSPPPTLPPTTAREAPIIMAKPAKMVCRRDNYSTPTCDEKTAEKECPTHRSRSFDKDVPSGTAQETSQGVDMRPRVTAITTCSILLDSNASLSTTCTSHVSVECNTILRVPALSSRATQRKMDTSSTDRRPFPWYKGV